jgi:hypothetical protein
MLCRIAVASLAALLVTVPGALAQGDPTMPMSELREGMKCTAYSVIRGTEPTTFNAEVLDVVGGDAGARILVRVSGDAVDETGIGAGFSGSPIYCPGSDGKLKNAGAISETIGEYGGKTVLATPIEQILSASPDPPAEPGSPPAPAGARSLAAISVRGLDRNIFEALQRAGRRYGRTFIQAAPMPLQSPSPATPGLRPGSAVSVGLSNGDLSIGAVGTVAYTDGDKVWSFGHQFDAVGRRSLFLQGAYVAAVIGNPVQSGDGGGTYKLAGATDDRGTATNDTISAVAGKLGGLPPSVPVRVFAKDEDSGRETTTEVNVADETDIGNPAGASALSFIAPLTVTQGASGLFDSTPIRIAGEMCLRIALRERKKPIRVCNRYVSDGTGGSVPQGGNLVGLLAGSDVSEILTLIDTYRPKGLHITEVAARVRVRRGQQQAIMRSVRLPARVRAGQRVTARMKVRRVRGATETISFPVRIPGHVKPGKRRVAFRGSDPDSADDDLFGTLTIELGDEEEEEDTGPQTIDELVTAIRKIDRYDGIRVKLGGSRRAYEHPSLRVGGRAATTVRVVR